VTISTVAQTPRQRRDIQYLHGALGFIRLLLASNVMLWVWCLPDDSFLFGQTAVGSISALYALLSMGQLFGVLFRPNRITWARWGQLIDPLWAIALLWLLPNHAWVGLFIPITLWLAAFSGWSHFVLFLNVAVMVAAAAVTAQYHGILLKTGIDILPHGLILFATLPAFIVPLYGKIGRENIREHTVIDAKTGLPDQHALMDALRYLSPIHQRNLSPLSLLMIQLPSERSLRQALQSGLIAYLQARIRQSDLLVNIDARHMALLLCDTDESGASQLAQDIQQYRLDHRPNATLGLEIAICKLPITQFAVGPILDRMLNSLSHAEKHQITRIVFVSHS
jgi:GGDEF domain-containing protein